jgi:simple sugar transport system ATP-binding protein
MTPVFLEMKNISKRYAGVKALDEVNFDINPGEVHCLAGTNGSGKSTIIKIISGVEKPDPGAEIYIEGELSVNRSSIDSIYQGIEVIYQDLSLFPNLTVAENIALSEVIAGKQKIVNPKNHRNIAAEAMSRIDVNIPLDVKVGELSIADQQLVAICRALTGDLKLLIMDEPTTALTRKEVNALLSVVTDLKSRGISTMFVSHKLDEVMEIAERVSVLRDGKMIGTYPASELDSRKLEYLMTGEIFEYTHNREVVSAENPILKVESISKKNNFRNISFSVLPGEIVGITGLLGSGRTELAMSIFGMNPVDSGKILLDGKEIKLDSVKKAVKNGIAYVPENRLVQGLVMEQSVSKNTVVTIIDRLLSKTRLIDHSLKNRKIDDLVERFKIKVPSVESAVSTLSGGNQQRVVLAKWIATNPKLLILDGPTVGIDIAAKGSIHEAIKQLADEGLGVIIISDEVPEVMNSCHRIFVMNRGSFTAEYITRDVSEQEVLDCISKAV